MRLSVLTTALFVGVLATLSAAVPLSEEEFQPSQYQLEYEPQPEFEQYSQIRERRSPQQNPPPPPPPNRGSVSVTGGHTSGQGGFVRGDYDHKLWQGQNGARLDANSFYQRNFGSPGPRQDYGGGVRLRVPFRR